MVNTITVGVTHTRGVRAYMCAQEQMHSLYRLTLKAL